MVKIHLPTRGGQRHRKLFDLAQALKGLKPDWDERELTVYFRAWWKEAVLVVRTKEEELSRAEFFTAYNDCRFAGGMDWVAIMAEAAKEPLPQVAEAYTEKGQTLVKLCSLLQKLRPDRPFFLSSRFAANLIGMSTEAVQATFRMLRTHGVLSLAERGSYSSGRASSYWYTAWRKVDA